MTITYATTIKCICGFAVYWYAHTRIVTVYHNNARLQVLSRDDDNILSPMFSKAFTTSFALGMR